MQTPVTAAAVLGQQKRCKAGLGYEVAAGAQVFHAMNINQLIGPNDHRAADAVHKASLSEAATALSSCDENGLRGRDHVATAIFLELSCSIMSEN